MSSPFKHIDMKMREDMYGNYYSAVDIAGRAWKITQFSLSGIWVLWPMYSKRKPIYVYSLYDADTLLDGGTVKDRQEIDKPKRVNMPKSDKQQPEA